MPIDPNKLPQLDLTAVEEELRKEQAYGERPVEAFAGEALSTATFGLSDAALVAAGVPAERLREVREREAEAALAGTITGAVAPALATLGTSAAAQAAAAPARAAMAAGTAAESIAAKALPAGVARTVGTAAARGAAEGAVAGAGELVSDVALERKELSAESVLGAVGTGALFGAGFGGVIGATQATMPGVKKAAGKVFGGGKKLTEEATRSITDNNVMASRTLAKTPLQAANLVEELGDDAAKLADFTVNDLKLQGLDSTTALATKNREVLQATGEELGSIASTIDDYTQKRGKAFITREEAWQPVLDELNAIRKEIKLKNVLKSELKEIDAFEADIVNSLRAARKTGKIDKARAEAILKRNSKLQSELEKLNSLPRPSYAQQLRKAAISREMENLEALRRTGVVEAVPFNFKEFNDKRLNFQRIKYPAYMTEESNKIKARIAGRVRGAMRRQTDEIAKRISADIPGLDAKLAAANKRYHIAATVEDYVDAAAKAAPDISSPFALGLTTAGRAARNIALLGDIGRRVTDTKNYITTKLSESLSPKLPKGSITSSASKILINSQMAMSQDGKKPKNKLEAFENVSRNVKDVAGNPDAMVDLLAKKTSRVAQADEEVGMVLQQRLASAVNFLNTKLPKPAVSSGVFERKYQPSSMELAKFERYMQVVEQPLTALDELKSGTLTREHVEALQAVYPEIYKEIQVQVLNKITEGDLKLPYAKKLQIGILLNIPADSALQPQTLLQLQQNLAIEPEQPQGGPQFRAAGMEQTGISERAQSGTEALSTRD